MAASSRRVAERYEEEARSGMDAVFKALADPSRRQMLDALNASDGQTLRDLCAGLAMARQSVSKHLRILESANLVTIVWRGREKLHYLNAEPINAIAERWINRYDRRRVHALADLKRALEEPSMSETEFVYTTYIKTTAERLWQALTDPAFTKQYWGVTLDTDWRIGSSMTWELEGVVMSDPEQQIIECEPGRRLSYRWHTLTPEFIEKFGGDDPEQFEQAAKEPRSTITFDIEPVGDLVKLTVIHGGFEPGSILLDGISQGWPAILSSLKTLLETGDPLPEPA